MMSQKLNAILAIATILGGVAAKGKLSRKIGIPLSRTGCQQKVGRTLGRLLPLICYLLATTLVLSMIAVIHAMY